MVARLEVSQVAVMQSGAMCGVWPESVCTALYNLDLIRGVAKCHLDFITIVQLIYTWVYKYKPN